MASVYTEKERLMEKEKCLELAPNVPQRPETWKLSVQNAGLGIENITLYVVNINVLSKTEKLDDPDPLVGFESYKSIPTINDLYSVICRSSVFPMNRNIINGKPKYLMMENGKKENSIDTNTFSELKKELQQMILEKLNIKIVDEMPKEENGTLLLCNSCSNPLIKIYRCANCKAVNYCQRECQVNDWKYHKQLCKYMKKHMEHLKSQVDELSNFQFLNSKTLDEHIIFSDIYNKNEDNNELQQQKEENDSHRTKIGGLWAIPQILDDTFTVEHRLSMTSLPWTIQKQQQHEKENISSKELNIKNDIPTENTTENDQEGNINNNKSSKENEDIKNSEIEKDKKDKRYEICGEITDGFSNEFLPWCQHFSLESGFQNSPKAISSWADYFKAKNSKFYPAALLLSTPLTLFYILNTITPKFRDLPKKISLAPETNLCIHIINPSQAHIEILELYQCLLPLIRRVTLDIFFIGPEMVALPLSKQPNEAYITQTLLSKRRDFSMEFKSETFESCIRLHLARCNYSNFPVAKYPPDLVLCFDATRNLLSKRIDEREILNSIENNNTNNNNDNNENNSEKKEIEAKTNENEKEKENKVLSSQSPNYINIFKHEIVNTIRKKLSDDNNNNRPYETTACVVIESTETECEIGKRLLKQECGLSNPVCIASTTSTDSDSIQLNPFRQPWLNKYPNMNVPRWKNGFIYGFKI